MSRENNSSMSYEFEINTNEELKQLGFEKFKLQLRGKTLVVYYKAKPIVSSVDRSDLSKTIKSMTKKFQEEGIDQKGIRVFVTFFTDEYLKLKESEHKPCAAVVTTSDGQETTDHIIEELKKLKEANKELVFEQWQKGLVERYNNVKSVAEKNFPHSWQGIEFTLSVQKILCIAECTLPFAGIMLARAGGNKTLSCSMIIPWPNVYHIRNFTAKAFVSHNTAVPKASLGDIDMLPKIRYKLLLTPELTPLFSASEDDLMENLGIITSILDGKGYISHSGAHGRRGYYGNYMFVWVGAAVDIPYRVQKLLSSLGPKLYFYRLPFKEKTDQELLDSLNENLERRKQVQDAVIDYLMWFEICPNLVEDKESGLLKMQWNSKSDEPKAQEHLKNLSKLLAKLGHVDIWSAKQHEYRVFIFIYRNRGSYKSINAAIQFSKRTCIITW